MAKLFKSPLNRMLLSSALVFACYSGYTTMALPLIEPPAAAVPVANNLDTPSETSSIDEINQKKLAPYFAEDSWERTSRPKVLMTERAIFVIKDHKTLNGDKVELTPFSMVVLPTKKAGQDQIQGHATIIQAPDGAVLEFDEPIDLTHIKSPHLIGGMLRGEINIYSKGTEPGDKDDLRFVTRDVELHDDSISTPHDVKFRIGQTDGVAREMEIKLKLSTEPGRRRGEIEGIQSFELRRNVRLEFVSPNMVPNSNNPDARDTPIRVTSHGPFTFDMSTLLARFTDHVDVVHINPEGPSDQLKAEALEVRFARRLDAGTRRSAGTLDLIPQIVEAAGYPVVIEAPSQSAHAECQRLEYNLANKRIVLEGSEEVVMHDRLNEIHTRQRLEYTPGPPGELASVFAKGPGRMEGTMPGDEAKKFALSWGEGLQLRPNPEEPNHVLALTGGARVSLPAMGNLDARKMYVYLAPSGAPAAANDKTPTGLVPKLPQAEIIKMQAMGEVQVNSPQLHGDVQKLMAWFERLPGGSFSQKAKSGLTTGAMSGGNQFAAAPPQQNGAPAAAGSSAEQPFDVSGGELLLKFVTRGQQSELSEAIVRDQVVIKRGQNDGMRPLKPINVEADNVRAERLDTPDATIEAQGHPAIIDAQGMRLVGNQIKVDQLENALWINGPGSLQLPVEKDVNGQKFAQPQTLKTDWSGGLEFNGLVAKFSEGVIATFPEQKLQADVLSVELSRKVDFRGNDPNGPREASPEIKIIDARKRVWIENQTHDPRTGELTAQDHVSLQYLTVNQKNGIINGHGPGRVISVRKGVALPSSNQPGNRQPQRPPANPNELTFTRLDFESGLNGVMRKDFNEITVEDRVNAVVGPVRDWNDELPLDDPDAVGERGMLLSSDKLTVRSISGAGPQGKSAMELVAKGTTTVKGQTFKALADELSYVDAKKLLTLRGDTRSPARIYYRALGATQEQKGEGRVISYNVETRDPPTIEGGGAFDFTLPGR